MSTVSFSGLSSGLDTTSLINSLVGVERAPATDIGNQQSNIGSQQSVIASLSSSMSALGTVMQGLLLPNALQPRVATSSDSHVTAAASPGATATTHSVMVEQLARGQISSSNTFTSNTAGVAGTGTIQITTGSLSGSVSYDSTDTLDTIAAKINGANAGASASVLFDGSTYRLMVAATQTGTANVPQFAETGGGLGLSDPSNVKISAKDAIAEIDGVDVTRSSNVISDAVNGVTFTLQSQQATTDPPSQVAVALDTTAVTSQLSSFVSSYNTINSALHAQLDYTGTAKGTDTLFGDSTLTQLQNSLATVLTAAYGSSSSTANSLGALGLTMDSTGALTLDTTKLDAALATNPNAISDVFATGGFAQAVTKVTNAYTDPADGFLTTKTKSLTDQVSDLQKQADQINANADALQTTLQLQFNNLETLMTSLKSQSSFLTSVLSS